MEAGHVPVSTEACASVVTDNHDLAGVMGIVGLRLSNWNVERSSTTAHVTTCCRLSGRALGQYHGRNGHEARIHDGAHVDPGIDTGPLAQSGLEAVDG